MVSFLLGWAAGTFVTRNRRYVQRGAARFLVKSGSAVVGASHQVYRFVSEISEDIEDATAEIAAERSADEQARATATQLLLLREELAKLETKLTNK